MKGQVFIILFRGDLAFLIEEVALDFNQVQIAFYPVQFRAPAFWTIRVINYIENEKRLHVEVLSYHVGEAAFPANQIELADTLIRVEKVSFKSIDTAGFLKTLNSKEPVKILPPEPETVYRQETAVPPETKMIRDHNFGEPFSFPIKDLTFISGGVSFEKKIQRFEKPISFLILNEHIIDAYDAIKNYFANVLKTKRIQVVPIIRTTDGIIVSVDASSPEIDKIDKTLIEEAKFEWVKGAGRKEIAADQMFTVNEYLETVAGEDTGADQVFKDENDFFENLLNQSGTKHYHQLRFLSSKHQSDLQKLYFIHKPLSFVFVLKGNDKLHIVWETLDTSEATYAWTIANDAKALKDGLGHANKIIENILEMEKMIT